MKIGILMDPIANIDIKKDTSFALLLTAQERNHTLHYLESKDIFIQDAVVYGKMRKLTVEDNLTQWYQLNEEIVEPLHTLDVLLMRKDPPFNMQYIYLTYLLELAEADGLWVINKPQSLRDANEKVYTTWFPECCPRTLITSQPQLLKKFIDEEKSVVIKPLGAMAGRSVFQLERGSKNNNSLIETLTQNGREFVMMQTFIPEISAGDKRIILIDGKPIPYALARIPHSDDFRGNLAQGAKGMGQELSDRDRWICEQVAPVLQEKGLWLVGLDIIGDYLTEINVTSPTGIRELNKQFDLDIGRIFFEFVESR